MTNKPEIRRLSCSCCGETTCGVQFFNMDTGYGLCNACIPYVEARLSSDQTMLGTWGVVGVNYGLSLK